MGFVIREPQPDTIAELDEPEPVLDSSNRKLCPCGKMFTPYRTFQRYHNDACRVKYEAKRPSRYVKRKYEDHECPQCGTIFNTNDGKKIYCNNECYLAHEAARHVKPHIVNCIECHKDFITTHWSKRRCDLCKRG